MIIVNKDLRVALQNPMVIKAYGTKIYAMACDGSNLDIGNFKDVEKAFKEIVCRMWSNDDVVIEKGEIL